MAAPLRSRPESGREGIQRTTRHALRQSFPLSSIRTVTVGFGFTPNLLTLPNPGRRSRALAIARHHRRWGLSPRPENVGRTTARPWVLRTQWKGVRNRVLGRPSPADARRYRAAI